MRISDWSSDVCSSDLPPRLFHRQERRDPAIAIAAAFAFVPVDRDRPMIARQPPFQAAQAGARPGTRAPGVGIAAGVAGRAIETVDDAKAPAGARAMVEQRGGHRIVQRELAALEQYFPPREGVQTIQQPPPKKENGRAPCREKRGQYRYMS